ncbi:MAG: 2OG-Fe(II) oxygenase [Cyanobacteria bacterium SZAS LIN-2]|nr:2OG-Fe(II) oxygenase [Cyanobacteria bacterium SZAS LIN-2]
MVETIQQLNGQSMAAGLNERGYTVINSLLDDDQCRSLIGIYDEDSRFRKRVVMQSHGYGKGEYRYLSYPLPFFNDTSTTEIYTKLVPIANAWHEAMKMDVRFPQSHAEFLERCHKAGQVKPTPLILKYEASDYNCLHQDLYGEHVFPLQLAILLSAPGDDFSGGEFVLTEQRPRMQSRVHVVPLKRGDAVVFAVNNRPVAGTRGNYKVVMRHGVSEIRNGKRFTAGIIFHDAG